MALIRFQLDLAIPKDVYDLIPLAKKTAFRDVIRALKAYAVIINEGATNEEMTIRAVWHKCYHDEGLISCEPEVEI